MRSSIVAVILCASLSSAAFAGPGAAGRPSAPTDKGKDPFVASILAFGATALGLGFAVGGQDPARPDAGGSRLVLWAGMSALAVGPSAGHFYAGEVRHGLVLSAVRGVAVFAMAYPWRIVHPTCADCRSTTRGLNLIAWGGLAVWGGLTIYDLLDARRAAHRANDRARSLTIAPTVLPTPDGRTATGLVVAGTF